MKLEHVFYVHGRNNFFLLYDIIYGYIVGIIINIWWKTADNQEFNVYIL